MEDVQVDDEGDLRCPRCGARAFRQKRSLAAKLALVPTVGIGTLAAPKRLKCLACGVLLRAGNAKRVRPTSVSVASTRMESETATPSGSSEPFQGGGELELLGTTCPEELIAALGRVTRMPLKERRAAVRRLSRGSVRVQVRDDMRASSAAKLLAEVGSGVRVP